MVDLYQWIRSEHSGPTDGVRTDTADGFFRPEEDDYSGVVSCVGVELPYGYSLALPGDSDIDSGGVLTGSPFGPVTVSAELLLSMADAGVWGIQRA